MEYNIPPCFYRLSVKALIHNDEWKFLLVKEDNNLWELPGGWVDYWENIQDCLRREIKEEMWLETTFIASEPSYFFTGTNLKWRNIANALYKTKVKNYDFTPSEECIELGFFTLEEAKQLDTYPNIQEFLKHYNSENHVHL
jgi:8-oxo-dGTP diphosphatase